MSIVVPAGSQARGPPRHPRRPSWWRRRQGPSGSLGLPQPGLGSPSRASGPDKGCWWACDTPSACFVTNRAKWWLGRGRLQLKKRKSKLFPIENKYLPARTCPEARSCSGTAATNASEFYESCRWQWHSRAILNLILDNIATAWNATGLYFQQRLSPSSSSWCLLCLRQCGSRLHIMMSSPNCKPSWQSNTNMPVNRLYWQEKCRTKW